MPLDPNIILQAKGVQLENPMAQYTNFLQAQGLQQRNSQGALQAQRQQRDYAQSDAFDLALRSNPNATDEDLYRAGGLKAAPVIKARQDALKVKTDIAKDTATTKKTEQETAFAGLSHMLQGFATATSARDVATIFDNAVAAGYMPPEVADQKKSQIPSDPAQFQQYRQQQILGGLPLLDQVKQSMPDANARLSSDTSRANNAATVAATQRGQNKTEAIAQGNLTMREKEFERGPVKPGGAMSVTLQKELLESDDAAQSANNVVRTLNAAKKINDKAYSGYFAKSRAVAASNLIPGDTSGADATIDVDNMMTGQALESLKLIFGGQPTEGERKILVDMQASVDKTPKQREAIMDRAIAAAERRGKYAQEKAKSIREGRYLTEGLSPMADEPSGSAPKPIKSDADYDALPSGAEFIAPDGSHRRKP